MTSACRGACCSVTPRLTVSELFERGFRRNRSAPLPLVGPIRVDDEGNFARFSLAFSDARIESVSFNASSCATLIAYVELVLDTPPVFKPEIVSKITDQEIVRGRSSVLDLKQGRTALAVAAFHAALESNEFETGDQHESRLHIRHPSR